MNPVNLSNLNAIYTHEIACTSSGRLGKPVSLQITTEVITRGDATKTVVLFQVKVGNKVYSFRSAPKAARRFNTEANWTLAA